MALLLLHTYNNYIEKFEKLFIAAQVCSLKSSIINNLNNYIEKFEQLFIAARVCFLKYIYIHGDGTTIKPKML